MPTQVQRQPNDSITGHNAHGHPSSSISPVTFDQIKLMQQGQSQQQQQQLNIQHREALRLALGSILTPKRPPLSPAHSQQSRSSSGAASPAHPYSFPTSGSPSGTHTPKSDSIGTPPVDSPGHFLHPHYFHGYHPLQPSRLGRSSSSGSPTENPSSAHHSTHPSPTTVPIGLQTGPLPALGHPNSKAIHSPASHLVQAFLEEPHINPASSARMTPVPNDIEMLPPAWAPDDNNSSSREQISSANNNDIMKDGAEIKEEEKDMKPVRPGITPLRSTPSQTSPSASVASDTVPVIVTPSSSSSASAVPSVHTISPSVDSSGRGTPKSKFLQTLQSKSAYDALIHGSFS